MSLVRSGEATVAGILGAVFKKVGSMGVRLSEKCKGSPKQTLLHRKEGTIWRALELWRRPVQSSAEAWLTLALEKTTQGQEKHAPGE